MIVLEDKLRDNVLRKLVSMVNKVLYEGFVPHRMCCSHIVLITKPNSKEFSGIGLV